MKQQASVITASLALALGILAHVAAISYSDNNSNGGIDVSAGDSNGGRGGHSGDATGGRGGSVDVCDALSQGGVKCS